uniref:Carbon catabolite repressor protein putative n=1 Tax=Albugo laibachii Nc14 TaxID=890382 RepID=F0VZ49_9STRA|nr:carbon catabolite repressor protein putative [Albugo laibachii Nc14]|eukprot:CCA14064.1 carbon catabolite repressor protein putative [Albugo laibachii Nc14]
MRSPRSAYASPRNPKIYSSSSSSSPYRGSPSLYTENRISLRIDQPIETCQVAAHVFYRSIDSDSDENKVDFEFSWYRSALSYACTNKLCPKKGDGNIVLLTANVECFVCYQLGISREFSAFCGAGCFKMAWNDHKHLHESHKAPNLEHTFGELGELDKSRPWKAMLEHSCRLFQMTEEEWIDLKHKSKTYVATTSDIGHILRVECRVMRQSTGLLQSKVVDTGIVLPFPIAPPKRQMLANMYEERQTPRLRQIGVFRVLSYNVLAELYATRQLYPYCPMWVLSWNFRKELLKNELHSYNADILCLQEVQGDHYKTFFYPMMSEWGYDGWYLKKSRESMGLEGKVDGCALFYKRNRFILKEQHPLEFNTAACDFASSVMQDFELTYPNSTASSRDASQLRLKTRLMRDNVGQIAILEAVPPNNEFSKKPHSGPMLCVANVHIFSNPKFPDVKMWQTFTLVKKIERILSGRDLPVVLCGDFNSEPSSAVYQFLSRNHVASDHEDLQPLASVFNSIEIAHCLALASSYASVFRSEPEYTNYTGHWTGVVDYVWYTPSNLALFAALKMHSPETLEAYAKTPLPNCQHTSDHVPLCLDFSFKAPLVNGRYVT